MVLHFLVLIEKSISAIFILRSKIKQKEKEDGWTPASQSMKGPSSHEQSYQNTNWIRRSILRI